MYILLAHPSYKFMVEDKYISTSLEIIEHSGIRQNDIQSELSNVLFCLMKNLYADGSISSTSLGLFNFLFCLDSNQGYSRAGFKIAINSMHSFANLLDDEEPFLLILPKFDKDIEAQFLEDLHEFYIGAEVQVNITIVRLDSSQELLNLNRMKKN